MPGLLLYAPAPALSRWTYGHVGPCTLATARPHSVRLSWRRVLPRNKAPPTISKAGRQNVASGQGPQDFLTVASKESPFKDLEADVLEDLYHQGQDATLPSGHKLAEEGATPTACYVLLHSCFLTRNGEGKWTLCLMLTSMWRKPPVTQHLARDMTTQ